MGWFCTWLFNCTHHHPTTTKHSQHSTKNQNRSPSLSIRAHTPYDQLRIYPRWVVRGLQPSVLLPWIGRDDLFALAALALLFAVAVSDALVLIQQIHSGMQLPTLLCLEAFCALELALQPIDSFLPQRETLLKESHAACSLKLLGSRATMKLLCASSLQ